MKFLLNVLLFIYWLFSIIKTGMGINCHYTDNLNICIPHLKYLIQMKSNNSLPESELEKIGVNLTTCLKNNKKMTEVRCPEISSKCSKFTIKFKDGNKVTVRFCETVDGKTCAGFKAGLEIAVHESRIDDISECDPCDTDGCNSEDNSKSEGKELYCYQTVPEALCWDKVKDLHSSTYGFGGNKYELENDALSCLKREHNEMYMECDKSRSVCSKLTLKFKDGKQSFFTYCDTMIGGSTLECYGFKYTIDEVDLADTKCDYCSVNGCNSSPKNSAHLVNTSYPAGSPDFYRKVLIPTYSYMYMKRSLHTFEISISSLVRDWYLCRDENILCHQTDFQDLCIPETLKMNHAKQLQKYNLYEYVSDALSCYKRKKRENIDVCPKGKTRCSKLTLKFYDGTHTSAKTCDTILDSICEYYKEKAKIYFPGDISSAQCDYCNGDSCNNEELDESGEYENDLSCFETELDYMCERELTNWKKRLGSSFENNALKCLKSSQNGVNYKRCKSPNSECAKLSLKFKDGVETEFRFCDSHTICEKYKEYLSEIIKDELLYAQCDQCSTNGCNSKLDKTKFRNEEESLRCYQSDLESCMGKVSDKYAFISCASQAKIEQKEDCKFCATEIYTSKDNQKMGIVSCGILSETLCQNSSIINDVLQHLTENKLKSVICIPCKYDLCNDIQKHGLGKNEARNQVVSNSTVIIFIFLFLNRLMF